MRYREMNKLTQELIKQGYSIERPEELPKGIRLGSGMDRDQFVFTQERLWNTVFIAPCGRKVKGIKIVFDGLSMGGVTYQYENYNPLIVCPFDYENCEKQTAAFKDLSRSDTIKHLCSVCPSSEVWQYEGSIEEAHDRNDRIKRESKKEYLREHPNMCGNQIVYNKKQWKPRFDFNQCILTCSNGCEYCPINGGPISKKKANVFFDIRKTQTNPEFKGSLFEGDELVSIAKGNRYFNSPISVDLCERFVKSFSYMILDRYRSYHFSEFFFAERRGDVFKVEIENVRIEQKESRDLLQDLQDIQEGIQVVHVLDSEKAAKARKKEERAEAKKKKENRIIRKENEAKQINLFDDLGGFEDETS